jgi:hypothetical protein
MIHFRCSPNPCIRSCAVKIQDAEKRYQRTAVFLVVRIPSNASLFGFTLNIAFGKFAIRSKFEDSSYLS